MSKINSSTVSDILEQMDDNESEENRKESCRRIKSCIPSELNYNTPHQSNTIFTVITNRLNEVPSAFVLDWKDAIAIASWIMLFLKK